MQDKIPWQCKQNIFKTDVALKHCAAVWDTDLLVFFFPSLAQMVGWAAVEFDMLISTPGKVLCLHRFLPCHHPYSASCRLPPGTGGTCAREQTRPTPGHSSLWFWETADQAANGGCYSLCRSWCMELGGCLDLGARQRQVSEWCPRTETVQCCAPQPPTSLPTSALTQHCSILAACSLLSIPTRWSSGNRSTWSVFAVVFAAHRKELTFAERVDPGAEAAVLRTPK